MALDKVRTRFAPSPTGALHAGTVRTALFAWLSAQHSGGQFLLRIEDTDKNREVENGIQNITESLKYLGLNWDEGPDTGGPHGPYVQSARLEIYKEWAEKLVASGRAYADPYTPAQMEEFRQLAKQQKKPFLYREHRPTNPPKWGGSQPLRFMSEPKAYSWTDEVMGKLSTGPEVVDDFILIKSDGFPTYNFAHIIDDHLMEINLVVRSQEFIASMPNFLNLYEALAIERPKFATVPMVLGEDGKKKLSKREGAKQLLEYKQMGILPAALINALATTGWNDGTEQEIFTVEEIINKFELSRVQKSGARFDEKRLTWLNGHYIRQLSLAELYDKAQGFWQPKGELDYQKAVLRLVQERLKYLAELPELTDYFFNEPGEDRVAGLFSDPPDKQLKKIEKSSYKSLLLRAQEELELSDFSPEDIASRLNQLLSEQNTKPGILFALIRIAVTGSASSPEIFGTLATLGKEKSLRRLKLSLQLLGS